MALTLPMIWIGVYPSTFLRPMDAAVSELMQTMEERGANIAGHNGGQSAVTVAEQAGAPGGTSWLRKPAGARESAE